MLIDNQTLVVGMMAAAGFGAMLAGFVVMAGVIACVGCIIALVAVPVAIVGLLTGGL